MMFLMMNLTFPGYVNHVTDCNNLLVASYCCKTGEWPYVAHTFSVVFFLQCLNIAILFLSALCIYSLSLSLSLSLSFSLSLPISLLMSVA